MTPMFLVCSSEYSRGIFGSQKSKMKSQKSWPQTAILTLDFYLWTLDFFRLVFSKVSERAVGLGHTMHIHFLFDRVAFVTDSGGDFIGQFFRHRPALFAASGFNQPMQRQKVLAFAAHRIRNLIVTAANATAAHFHLRRDIFHGLIKRAKRVRTFRFINFAAINHFLQFVKAIEQNLFRYRSLAVVHEIIGKLSDQKTAVT